MEPLLILILVFIALYYSRLAYLALGVWIESLI